MIKRNYRIAWNGQKSRKISQNHHLLYGSVPDFVHVRVLSHRHGRNEKTGTGLYGPGKGRHTRGIKDPDRRKKGRTDEADVYRSGQMYLVRGYGKKESSGYSIEVKELYETENAIHICTELKGPGEKEQVIEKNTWPYLVVKLDYQDRHVVFEE